MRLPIAFAVAALVSGCASTMQFKSSYQETSQQNEYGEVYANLSHYHEVGFDKNIKNQIEIFIDDELVAKAPLYEDYSGELYFFYHGMPVAVDCVRPHIFTTPECAVQVNGKRSGKLTFKM